MAGCLNEPSEIEAEQPVTVTGTSFNGLDPEDFHPHAVVVVQATKRALYAHRHEPGDRFVIHPDVRAMFASPAGTRVLKHVLACGLPPGTQSELDGEPLPKGLLGSTEAWATGALDDRARGDLFACLAAHLNGAAPGVALRLAGAAIPVLASPEEEAETPFAEALYARPSLEPSGGLVYRVRVAPSLFELCGPDSAQAQLAVRICGGQAGCRAEVSSDLSGCVTDRIGTSCDGQPMLASFRRVADLGRLFPGCGTPQS